MGRAEKDPKGAWHLGPGCQAAYGWGKIAGIYGFGTYGPFTKPRNFNNSTTSSSHAFAALSLPQFVVTRKA